MSRAASEMATPPGRLAGLCEVLSLGPGLEPVLCPLGSSREIRFIHEEVFLSDAYGLEGYLELVSGLTGSAAPWAPVGCAAQRVPHACFPSLAAGPPDVAL